MRCLLNETEIQERVKALGEQLSREYADRPFTVLGVLTGSIVFVADVIRQIRVPLQVGFVRASSYRGRTTRGGALQLELDLLPDIEGRDVLVVDDIFDTGRTLAALCEVLLARTPRSLRSAVLLTKRGRAEVEYRPDYSCFEIPDEFVVGYGLDYNGEHRHLPAIVVLEDDDL